MRESPDPVASFYDAVNSRDFSLLDQSLAVEWIDHQPDGRGDKASFIAAVRHVLEAFPDLVVQIDDRIDAPSHVTLRLTIRGTHMRDYLGIRGCGRSVAIRSHDIHRVEHGRIVESWGLEDNLGRLEQLGLICEKDAQ